jgi:WD40 repeat protein
MLADGRVRGGLGLQYDNGRPTGRLFRVRAGPDGKLWGSAGGAMMRLSDEGIVEQVLRDEAAPDDLGAAIALALDSGDRIYAADQASGAVHVFGSDGTLQHICRLDREDVPKRQSPSLTVTQDGRVFLLSSGKDRYIEFSAAGQLVARHPWPDRARLSNPAAGGFWALNDTEIGVVDEKGRTTRTLTRRADGNWLEDVEGAVVAPDGSIAVAAWQQATSRSHDAFASVDSSWTLNLYAPGGSPTLTLRESQRASRRYFAYDAHNIVVWWSSEKQDLSGKPSGEIRILDLAGKPVRRFEPRPKGQEAREWPLFLAADGRELWMFDAAAKVMHRYEMP